MTESAVHPDDSVTPSPNYLYLDHRLRQLANGRTFRILDVGCGDGRVISYLRSRGHDVWGCELPWRTDALVARFGAEFGQRVRVTTDAGDLPFEAETFDAVFANQVFEHVEPLPGIVAACRRILKPGGVLLAPFPLLSTPIEPHVQVPFVHWFGPNAREPYLRWWYALKQRAVPPELTPAEYASRQAQFLNTETCYRTRREVERLLRQHFEEVELDTAIYVTIKLDMLKGDTRASRRVLARVGRLVPSQLRGWLVTYLINACFLARVANEAEAPEPRGTLTHPTVGAHVASARGQHPII